MSRAVKERLGSASERERVRESMTERGGEIEIERERENLLK
jgi:hypothetical protein